MVAVDCSTVSQTAWRQNVLSIESGQDPLCFHRETVQGDITRSFGGIGMHASMAYINGAGLKRRSGACRCDGSELELLNTLLSRATGGTLKKGKSKGERQAEEESKHETASKPGGYPNDPDDPTNPNEVRERYLENVHKKVNR
jgi:hypothetical protein